MSPQVGRSPICRWGKRRNSYRKNEEVGQSGKHTQLWMCLVVKVKSDDVKSNIA